MEVNDSNIKPIQEINLRNVNTGDVTENVKISRIDVISKIFEEKSLTLKKVDIGYIKNSDNIQKFYTIVTAEKKYKSWDYIFENGFSFSKLGKGIKENFFRLFNDSKTKTYAIPIEVNNLNSEDDSINKSYKNTVEIFNASYLNFHLKGNSGPEERIKFIKDYFKNIPNEKHAPLAYYLYKIFPNMTNDMNGDKYKPLRIELYNLVYAELRPMTTLLDENDSYRQRFEEVENNLNKDYPINEFLHQGYLIGLTLNECPDKGEFSKNLESMIDSIKTALESDDDNQTNKIKEILFYCHVFNDSSITNKANELINNMISSFIKEQDSNPSIDNYEIIFKRLSNCKIMDNEGKIVTLKIAIENEKIENSLNSIETNRSSDKEKYENLKNILHSTDISPDKITQSNIAKIGNIIANYIESEESRLRLDLYLKLKEEIKFPFPIPEKFKDYCESDLSQYNNAKDKTERFLYLYKNITTDKTFITLADPLFQEFLEQINQIFENSKILGSDTSKTRDEMIQLFDKSKSFLDNTKAEQLKNAIK